MASLRELIIKISANSSSFQTEISRASRMGADYYKTMEQGGRKAAAVTRQQQQALQALNAELASVKAVAAGMTGVIAGAFAVGSLIETADNWGQLSSRIKMATESGDEYNMVQARLMEISDRTYKAIEEQGELYIRSATAMKELGYSTESTINFIDSISSALTINAASADKGASAINALSKSMVVGKVSGGEWQTVMEVMPTVIGDVARHLGMTETAVKKLASEGKLSMQTFSDAVIAAQKRNAELAENMPTTVGDAITKLSNHWKKYIGEANNAYGATQVMSGGIGMLADNIETVGNVTGVLIGIGVARYLGNMTTSLGSASVGLVQAKKGEVALAAAQLEGTKVSTARSRAAVYRAQQALAAAKGTDGQSAAERRLAASQQALTRNIAARTAAQTALNSVTSVGSRLMSGALGLVGGIPGLVMMGAGAWYYMHQQQEQARASAEAYVKTLDEVRTKLPTMTLPDISDHKKNAQNSLDEYSKKIKEQTGLVERLERQIVALKETQSAGISGGYTQYMMARNPSKGVPDTSGDVTEKLKQSTEQLATERARLNQIQQEAGSIGLSLEGIERRRVDLIREQAWRDNAAYQSLVMMTGQHTEFNRILGLGNTLLATRQGLLVNAPLRMPQATVTDTEQQSLLQKQQAAELAGLEGIARVRKQAQFDLQKMGKTGPENSAYAAQYTQAMEKEFTETQRLAKAKKDGVSATNAHNKAENESAKTAEQYSRKIADLSIAVEVQKVRANQGEKAADLYAASHENGAKWTNEQRKAIEASAVELATWTQKADEAVRKQREMADALKDLTDAARKYRDDAAASEKTRGMGQRQREQFDEEQQIYRIFDKSDKGTAAVAAKTAALDALGMKYKEAKAAEADWMAGVSAGLADWVDEASDYAGQAADATKNAMGGMVNNITDMLNGNKASWKDWSISVLKEIEKVLVNAALVNSLKSLGGGGGILGALGGLFGGGAATSGAASAAGSAGVGAMGLSTNFAAYDLGGFTGLGAKYEPAGVVHKGEFVFTKEATERIGVENLYGMMRGYADGGLVSTSPVAGGSPGVRALTASQPIGHGVGGDTGGNVYVTINENGSTSVAGGGEGENFAREFSAIIQREYIKLRNKDLSQGGAINSAIRGGR
ncbi:phage tail tape measure protein [Serratia fonticola]|uniref:phage tail tape measure protein n=1 Tax=Serratia fonticola TaxID=47917 RepID=UPI0027E89E4B|nr:phage tail tape measure protein [Serratia fonticola]MDQ7208518.1 phage tail tape measure protein [Serratia fonticola]HBE9151661.1 phage tail tape measure protein [Serratia fonticola]